MTLDLDAGRAVWHRTEYDIGSAQQAILAAGLPGRLASRLREGR